MKKANNLILLAIAIFCIACGSKKDVDVSNISVDLTIKRFEKDLFASEDTNALNVVTELAKKHGAFFELFGARIIKEGYIYKAGFPERLQEFKNFQVHQEVWEMVQEKFDSLAFYPQLLSAFKHYKYYFPDKNIPEIYTFIGGFNQSIVIGDGFIGIGLDKYLGTNCTFYSQLGIEHYKKEAMYANKIPTDCMLAVAESEFSTTMEVDKLLGVIINEGRKVYFAKQMMPAVNDTVFWGFSRKKLEYCEEYERDMWQYLINNELLFNSEYLTIRKFTGFGPFTAAFSKQSPARAACWLGYRIVAKYADNNPEVSLMNLMNESDYQKILQKSRYNP